MKIENQVCTLEQAIKLRELGVDGESLFVHLFYPDGEMHHIGYRVYYPEDKRQIRPAYTVAELVEMLPTGYDSMRISGYNPEQFFWMAYDLDGKEFPANGSWKPKPNPVPQ